MHTFFQTRDRSSLVRDTNATRLNFSAAGQRRGKRARLPICPPGFCLHAGWLPVLASLSARSSCRRLLFLVLGTQGLLD